MIESPKIWMEHEGQAILNSKGIGFFLYNDKGWIHIVEVYWSEKSKSLRARTHPIIESTMKRMMKSKKMPRRIAYKLTTGMTEKLIMALSNLIKPEERIGETDKNIKEAKQEAKDSQISDWLKKSGL